MKFQTIDPADMLKRKQEDIGFRSSSQLTYCEMFQPGMFGDHNLLETMTQRSSENDLDNMIRDDEFESKSGTDIMEPPSDDQDPNQRPKKKRYHRHTPLQIQEMESFFKECPHPDDKQRKELGRRLSLEPLQVKFWFQNKRTQMKAQHERHDNSHLRNENEKLRLDNIRYKDALATAACPNCGGPASIGEMSFDEQHLRMENARLKEEIDRISGIAARYVGKPMMTYPNPSAMTSHALDLGIGGYGPPPGFLGDIYSAGELLRSVSGPTEADRPMIIDLAVAAMEELITMAKFQEPLWIPNNASSEILSEDEYVRTFPRGIGPKPLGLRSEASRETAVVIMSPINLVEILLDVNQWTCMFASIVSRAMTLDVLSTGVAGNYDGALQVMTAEFQVPTPLVPTREHYFLRYCKHNSVDGTWSVVDVSLDNLRPNNMSRCRRRPSGCVIRESDNGCSQVTWVEHVEVDDRAVHNIFRGLVTSGLAFGAKRWLSTLDRQCKRLVTAMANNIPMGDAEAISTAQGRKSMLKLAERMVMSFCAGVGASTAHTWTTLSGTDGADDVRVMTRKSMDDPGKPPGIVLSAATSFWTPASPKRVFDFLSDEKFRGDWDILSNGGQVQEVAQIANGYDPGNAVSLLRVISGNECQSNMLILQENSTDATGSYVIYAPIDNNAMTLVLNGGDPDYVALLPSGFAILPDGSGPDLGAALDPEIATSGGSLLTVAFQILVPSLKLDLKSVSTVNNLIHCTVDRIKTALALGRDNASL